MPIILQNKLIFHIREKRAVCQGQVVTRGVLPEGSECMKMFRERTSADFEILGIKKAT